MQYPLVFDVCILKVALSAVLIHRIFPSGYKYAHIDAKLSIKCEALTLFTGLFDPQITQVLMLSMFDHTTTGFRVVRDGVESNSMPFVFSRCVNSHVAVIAYGLLTSMLPPL